MFGHPWRWLRHLPHITVVWADTLPLDVMGRALYDSDTIELATGLTQAERRTTCWHEVQHLLRGPAAAEHTAREEKVVEEIVARDLIPFEALVDAMLWSRDDYEIADELTVDVALVRIRLEALTAAESLELEQALDAAELLTP